MTTYRVFPINDDGHVAGSPELLEAGSDEEALAAAHRFRLERRAIEVWDLDRLVIRLSSIDGEARRKKMHRD